MVVETVKKDKHTRKRKNKQYKKIYLHDYDEIVDVDATFGERWQSWKLIFICTRRCSDIDKLSKRKTLDDFLWRWAFCPSALGRQGSHLQKKLHGTPGNCGDDNDGDGGDVDADGDGDLKMMTVNKARLTRGHLPSSHFAQLGQWRALPGKSSLFKLTKI